MLLSCARVLLLATLVSCLTLPNEFNALYSLYNETDGTNWNFKIEPWNFSYPHDPCAEKWEGIGCNNSFADCIVETCGITKIFLPGVGMRYHMPDSIGTFSDLQMLAIQNNFLSGPIPSYIGSLYSLTVLSLSNNSFTSSIPSSLADLSNLVGLDLNTNLLSGPIPVEFENASFVNSLVVFYIGENHIHGPLPTSLSLMTKLKQIYVTENHLDGPLPELCDLVLLNYLGLATNSLYGTIPTCIGTNTQLKNFYLNYNSFDGKLPSSIGDIQTLSYLEVGGNFLTGEIPSELGKLSNLAVLELFDNSLQGEIPSELGRLVKMHTLQLHENSLRGQIPAEFGSITALKLLLLYSNQLTGSLPCAIGNNSLLEELTIYDNSISGYIPSSIMHLQELRNLLVQGNNIRGLDRGDDYSPALSLNLPKLQHLDISDNKFTGQIPIDIFTKLPSILSIAAIKNCFSGRLPDEICEAYSLQVLALDGLASGTKCRKDFVDPLNFIDSYYIRSLEGSIPPCIWQMANLTVIHLSGNGLTGTIPSLPAGSQLINISISHNKIDGTVPPCMRHRTFVELDLSYNKLGGVFEDGISKSDVSYADRSIFHIVTNRFSGYVPIRLDDVSDLSVVSGNLFDCDPEHPVPHNDPNKHEYVCGSKQLDQMLIIWAAIFFVAVSVAIVVKCTLSGCCGSDSSSDVLCIGHGDAQLSGHCVKEEYKSPQPSTTHTSTAPMSRFRNFSRRLISWFSMEELGVWGANVDRYPSLFTFIALIRTLRNTSILLSTIIATVGIPFYIILKTVFPKYSTHEYQYGWLYSAAFMSGMVPAVLLLLLFCALCGITSFSFVKLFPQHSKAENRLSVFFRETFVSTGRHSMGTNMAIGRESSLNPSISNVGDRDSALSTCQNLCFRGSFHAAVVSFNIIICLCANAIYVYTLLSESTYEVKLVAKVVLAVFQLWWNLFIVPKMVEFSAQVLSDLSSQMKWMAASMLLFNNIIAPALATAVTDDSCYNSLFTSREQIEAYYSYPYCAVYAVDVVTEERVCYKTSIIGLSTEYTPPFIYNYQCGSALLVNFTPVFLVTYAILAVVPLVLLLIMSAPSVAMTMPRWMVRSVPAIFWPPDTTSPELLSVILIKPDRIITNLMSHMSVHLTFGVASPLLAVTMSFSVISITSLHLTAIGRHLAHQHTVKAIDGSGGLETACTGVLNGLPACLWTILIGSSFVFSTLILDFAGDQVGWQKALFVAIPTLFVPAVAWFALRIAIMSSDDKKFASLSSRPSDLCSVDSEARVHLLASC